jgi:hypothetical protein
MRPNTFFLVAGALALVFGLGFLLAPGAVLPVYGVAVDPGITLMSRFFGAALVHLGVLLYLVRETRDPATQHGLALSGVVGSVAGLAVAVMAVLGRVVNVVGWSTVVIYAALFLGYASLLRARTALA